jgi:DNA-binding FadR family transcriptional regulator
MLSTTAVRLVLSAHESDHLGVLGSVPGFDPVPAASWQDLVKLFGAPMAAIVERKDLHAHVANYEELRARLIEAAALPALADLLHWLYDLTDIYVRRVLLASDRTHFGLRDHRAVLAALRAGDAEEAERMRRETIANIRSAVDRYSALVL